MCGVKKCILSYYSLKSRISSKPYIFAQITDKLTVNIQEAVLQCLFFLQLTILNDKKRTRLNIKFDLRRKILKDKDLKISRTKTKMNVNLVRMKMKI